MGVTFQLKKPRINGNDYYNRKKYHSVVLQGICKSNLMFTDVDCRWPGSVHDARIFRTSDIYPLGVEFCSPHYYILGDSAYPCKTWIVTPYRNNRNLTPAQTNFNLVLSKTRVKIEHAFALLKGRFRRLLHCLDMVHMEHVVKTVVACCVLHNICLIHEENDLQMYIDEGLNHVDPVFNVGDNCQEENDGDEVRTFLTEHLWNQRR
jgi:hypothetical protein